MIEELVDTQFRILRPIGAGGMADVYLAAEISTGRQVALKIMDPGRGSNVARFEREAAAAGALSHPNIVAVYGTGRSGDTYYIAMEYVPGATLKELIRERGALPEPEVIRLGRQIADALAYAHSQGIIHRDVKPHNILLNPDGNTLLADFGIAYLSDATELTLTHSILGSPYYLSPEQARGERVDARTDVYSLGVVLYEMATGSVPFDGDSAIAIVTQHALTPPTPPRARNAALSPELEAIILQALAKDAAARYQSAAALRADLERVHTGAPTSALHDSPTYLYPIDHQATSMFPSTRPAAGDGAVPPASAPAATSTPDGHLTPGVAPASPGPQDGVAAPAPAEEWMRVTPAMAAMQTRAVGPLTAAGAGADRAGAWHPQPLVTSSPVPSVRRRAGDAFASLGDRVAVGSGAALIWSRHHGDWLRWVLPVLLVLAVVLAGASTRSRAAGITVPDLRGMPLEEAQAAAAALGLGSEVLDEQASAEVAAGAVLSQEPAPGAALELGSPVGLTLSLGPPLVAVPRVVGLQEDVARERLTSAGLQIGDVQRRPASNAPAGQVVAQAPPPDEEVPSGTVTVLAVSTGPAPNQASAPPPAAPAPPSVQQPAPNNRPAVQPRPNPGRGNQDNKVDKKNRGRD